MNTKKKFKITPLRVIGILALVFFLWVVIAGSIVKKRDEKRLAELNANIQQSQGQQANGEGEYAPVGESPVEDDIAELTEDELEQQKYVEKYGVAPHGFKWDMLGNLIPLSDSELPAEEVCWRFLQALSNKDFITAQKYSEDSSCVNSYERMFGGDMLIGEIPLSAWVYKYALESIQIKSVQQDGIFSNSKFLFSVVVDMYDLSNKTFWENDKYEVFQNIYNISLNERDSYKVRTYINDLILDYYKNGDCARTDVTVLLSVTKLPDGGYLVSEDGDLESKFTYTEGTTVYDYITEKYSEWKLHGMPKEDPKPEVTKANSVTEEDVSSEVIDALYQDLERILNDEE